MHRQVFDFIHSLSHLSRRSTSLLLKTKFIWHSITKDVKDWFHACTSCKTSKVHRHMDSGVGTFLQPQRRFAHIHFDIVVPLPTSKGHPYLFTVIDRSTRWPEAIPMETATSASCTSALLSGWIARFAIPKHITLDRGNTFTSQLWTSLVNLLGITLHQTTANNSAANGMFERLHRTLKAPLMSHCKDSNWFTQLPWTYKPPAKHHIPTDLHSATHVFLCNDTSQPPLTPPYRGLSLVIRRNPEALLLNIRCKEDWVSIDRLKPAYLLPDDLHTVYPSGSGCPIQHVQFVLFKEGAMYHPRHTSVHNPEEMCFPGFRTPIFSLAPKVSLDNAASLPSPMTPQKSLIQIAGKGTNVEVGCTQIMHIGALLTIVSHISGARIFQHFQ
ncbi:uncharacterized protein [Palaemon carinicauda]|uniref:uncharacterized protein n=1 Tax=Palaemon carinicauda TaxID=392227 RepID=UPI0035B59423